MCDLCLRDPCMDPRCPNYSAPRTIHYCSECGKGIYDGDEYIENDNGEYRHFECFHGMYDLIDWLGYRVEVMDSLEDY